MADATQIYEEVIQKSQENVNNLATKLAELKQWHENIKELTAKSEQLPIEFDKKFGEIRSLSEQYTNDLGVATKIYLEGNNTLFTSHLKDLAIELKKFDAKSAQIQSKIDLLQKEITRLENIDLEKHFDKLQKTLSDIFGAINALNLSFTTIIQTLNTLVQSVGNISTKLESNHTDIQGSIKEFSSNILAHLKEQDIEIKRNQTSVDTQLKALVEQNEMLKKELKTNRMMLILGFVLVLIISAYHIIKH